ncbi:hypothetical protein JGG76_24235 [Salmonella enterica subsp. enterica serovar Derby]|nr:hypothetical protein [Salmonella enterica subsp. enterica serovar Derby]
MLDRSVMVQPQHGSRPITDIFLYEFKLVHNAVEAARNINIAFGDDAVNE